VFAWRATPKTACSSHKYDGVRADLLVARSLKLRIFVLDNGAVLGYSLTCILALFLPSLAPFGIFAGIVAALVLRVTRSRPKIIVAVCLGASVSCGHYYHYQISKIPDQCFDTPFFATGVIDSFIENREGLGESSYLTFDLDLQYLSPAGCGSGRRVRAYAPAVGDTPALRIGDQISGNIRLRPVESIWNRGNLPSNINSLAKGIAANASLTEFHVIAERSDFFSRLRYRLSESITYHAVSADAERLLQGLLIGRQDALSRKDWLFLRELGIVHVLVVSGVHVSLVVIWIQWLLGLPRRLSILPADTGSGPVHVMVVSIVAAGYVLLTGASLPAQRALLMMCMTLLMRVVFWRVTPLSCVVTSAAILITMNPWSALTSGFWLSVLLTGIMIIETERRAQSRVFGWLRLTLVLTFASSVLSVFFFHQFSSISFLSNLLIAPIFTVVVLPIGLLGLVLTELNHEFGGWVLQGVSLFISDLTSLAIGLKTLGGFNGLRSVFVHPGIFLVVATAVLACTLRGKPAVLSMLLLPLLLSSSSKYSPVTRLVTADVGQGTMVLITAGEFALLYDTGGVGGTGSAIAEREFIPWLRSQGLSVVDLLVVSHGDLDHSGGLSAVFQYFDIKQHWGFGGQPCVSGRELWPSDSLSIKVVKGTGQSVTNRNADSCVLLIETAGKRILLTGDITSAAELELLTTRSLPRKVDILVAAHHGSVTSSSQSFVDKVKPSHTIFTTKRGNRFNHPSNVIVDRFKTAGSILWDTARDGAVTFKLTDAGDASGYGMRTTNSPYWAQF